MALAAACAGPAAAQASGDFSSITLAAGTGVQTGSPWDGAWESSPLVSVHASTPFHHGAVRFGVSAWRNESAAADLPDFTAIHATGGWGPALNLPARVRLSPEVFLGALAFRFDDDGEFTGALRNETEVTAGVSLRADVAVYRGLAAWAGVDAVHVFTGPAENLIFMAGGISITMRAPGWFREALR